MQNMDTNLESYWFVFPNALECLGQYYSSSIWLTMCLANRFIPVAMNANLIKSK